MGDISSIRGRVLGMDAPDAGVQVIKAQAPYAEVVHYSPHLRSLTQRHRHLHDRDRRVRARCPATWQKKLVEQYQKEQAEGH